ncbi:hypothetical protein BaRGS_00027535 [Batillaria attramentaria]|uniref:Uncharacterized protein n=1 Tax=Batillaria attramentaria TaxID=370345 RepID=A0ABD0K2R8_9CAEN
MEPLIQSKYHTEGSSTPTVAFCLLKSQHQQGTTPELTTAQQNVHSASPNYLLGFSGYTICQHTPAASRSIRIFDPQINEKADLELADAGHLILVISARTNTDQIPRNPSTTPRSQQKFS